MVLAGHSGLPEGKLLEVSLAYADFPLLCLLCLSCPVAYRFIKMLMMFILFLLAAPQI